MLKIGARLRSGPLLFSGGIAGFPGKSCVRVEENQGLSLISIHWSVCVCARVHARKREHAHSAVHTLMHLCSETTNAETPIWHPPTRLHVEHIGGCICLGYIRTQTEEEQTYSMLKHVHVHTCPALSKLSTPTHASTQSVLDFLTST